MSNYYKIQRMLQDGPDDYVWEDYDDLSGPEAYFEGLDLARSLGEGARLLQMSDKGWQIAWP